MSQTPELQEIARNRIALPILLGGIQSLERACAPCCCHIREDHFNVSARVHGGVIFSLLDSRGAAVLSACWNHMNPTATVECKDHYNPVR